MTQWMKFRTKLMSGQSDANIEFADLTGFLASLGFTEDIEGSHHAFRMAGIPDIINLQPQGKMAKVYQVRQVRATLRRFGL